jgi:hypothetical protein
MEERAQRRAFPQARRADDPLPTETGSIRASGASEPRTRLPIRLRSRGWSIFGAERSQPVATGRKWELSKDGFNKPKPLPPVATSCRSGRMVRVHSLPVMEGVTSLAPQREVESREPEGQQDSASTLATRGPHIGGTSPGARAARTLGERPRRWRCFITQPWCDEVQEGRGRDAPHAAREQARTSRGGRAD